MPIVTSSYKPPLPFRNGHFSTIYSGLIRKVNGLNQERERIELSDSDYLDLDWSFSKKKTSNLIVIVHGLEGSGDRPYILGVAKLFNAYHYDAVALNLRSCSGAMNKLYRSYHSGATEDLSEVLEHISRTRNYKNIVLNGFSLGGNLCLKYIGETKRHTNLIKACVAVSTPCYLHGSMIALHKRENILYKKRFKKNLVDKLIQKQQLFPEKISDETIRSIISLKDFDDAYTAPAHGFKNALDYYEKSSSLQFIPQINIPTFILNAKNDSFLSEECYPREEALKHKNIFLEIPNYGGHVGFYDKKNLYYNEKRALEFIKEHVL